MNNFINSPIQKKQFQKQTIYIKRDDLLSSDFSGNKARKFHYFLAHNFPHIKKVVSYGSAQSNAMYSLSVLAKKQGWRFDYYTTHIADYLKENPHGNYRYALENGMNIYVEPNTPIPSTDKTSLFIEEGGRQKEAQYGLEILAKEIESWKEEQKIEELNIFLPSGTGTTALFLQKYSKDTVYTTPCVGGVDYLEKQFFMLEKDENFHPTILKPSKKRHFGKLYRDSYNIWLELQNKMGIEFDLLYDPHGWLTLLENPQIFEKPTLYIHQGGLIGNESMLARYQRKYSENI
ncbi:pyridoxal phosphate-dependent deaminase, putative [hydrothermal vent metagenome]|uniref:Pyridoxal phosphate-dependent deaminase, putative n=1 Tax=hydrothermal vent metagenome TaxID=652676 RepID=A0A1W1CST5_9ZZZZ